MKADEKARAFFLQGENVVMAYDSYNGLRLWKRNIPGAMRTGVSSNPSNLALNRDGLFLALQDKCFRLDVATGQTKQTYHLPEGGDKKSAAWGFVACVGNMLYGTPNIGRASNSVFAMDIESGDLRWTYTGKQISVPSISIADGRLFLVDRNITNEQRQTALTEKIAEIEKLKTEIGAKQKEIDSLKNELEQYKKNTAALLVQIRQQRAEIRKLRADK